MAGDPARKTPLSAEDAKRLLVDEAPAPLEVLLRDPADLVRRYPKEVLGAAVAAGVLIMAMPGLRRRLFSVAGDVAKIFLT